MRERDRDREKERELVLSSLAVLSVSLFTALRAHRLASPLRSDPQIESGAMPPILPLTSPCRTWSCSSAVLHCPRPCAAGLSDDGMQQGGS